MMGAFVTVTHFIITSHVVAHGLTNCFKMFGNNLAPIKWSSYLHLFLVGTNKYLLSERY